MRLAIRTMLAVLVTALLAGAARAQVMNQVPANAVIVVEIKDISTTNQKLIDFFKAADLSQDAPGFSDPLAYILSQAKITAGINKSGDFAFVMLKPGPNWNWDNAPLMLVPVTDYQAFIGNYADAKTEGDVTSTTFGIAGGQTTYIAHWGDYAALSPAKDNVATPPTSILKVTGPSADELSKRDIVALFNLQELRGDVLPALEQARTSAMSGIDQQSANPTLGKYVPVLKALVNQILNIPTGLFNDCDMASIGLNINPDGISAGLIADFHPDSYMGKVNAAAKNSDDSMLSGLPAGTYLFLGGSEADPKVTSQVVNDFLAPILTAAQGMGPDGKPIADYLSGIENIVSTQTSSTAAVIQPQGPLGAVPLLQFIAINRGDSKTMVAGEQQLINSQQDLMKIMENGMPSPTNTVYTPNAKTIDGVTFDEIHTALNPAQAGMMPPQVQMIMNFVYSQDGMSAYLGAVDDQTMLMVAGTTDDYLKSAITAVKANDNTVAQQAGLVDTASHLPKMRYCALYLPIDTLLNTVFSYSAKFGFDLGIAIPATDPIGVTLGTEGTAMHDEMYLPTKAVADVVDTVHKLQNVRNGAGGPGMGPGPGGPPPPGGL